MALTSLIFIFFPTFFQKKTLFHISIHSIKDTGSLFLCYKVHSLYIYIFFFRLFRVAPAACWSFQARGRIIAVAAGLCHSHSNARSLTHWARPGIEPTSSWILLGFLTTAPSRELPTFFFFFFLTQYFSIRYLLKTSSVPGTLLYA